MHRGASPEQRVLPEYGISLGRTVGYRMNGAVSNLAVTAGSMARSGTRAQKWRVRRGARARAQRPGGELVRGGGEPGAHRRHLPHLLDEPRGQRHRRQHRGRAPALRQAERADRRVRGRGVDRSPLLRWPLPGDPERRGPRRRPARALAAATISRSSSSAAPRAARACPILLRAFEALRGAGIGARLTIAGVPAEEVEPLLLDPEGVRMVGRVTEEEKWRLLGSVDVLCAPSLGGESFGMVLTEAFASGTPGRGLGHRRLSRRGPERRGRDPGPRGRRGRARRGAGRAGVRSRSP